MKDNRALVNPEEVSAHLGFTPYPSFREVSRVPSGLQVGMGLFDVDVQRSARKPRGFPPLTRLPPEPS